MLYTITEYGSMIRDKVRVDAYYRALKTTVKEGDLVLDVGAGTGIFAQLACEFGAKNVYAVEPNEVIDIGEMIADANGLSSKIKFLKGTVDQLYIDTQVDVVVSDLRGRLPLIQGCISSLMDARDRLLRPGGTIIPISDVIYATYIESPEFYEKKFLNPWTTNSLNVNMRAGQPFQLNTPIGINWTDIRTANSRFLLEEKPWVTLDYASIQSTDVSGNVEWEVSENGTIHFLVLWFRTFLTPEITYQSGPFEGSAIAYGQTLFPLSRPISLEKGDRLKLDMKAFMRGDNYEYDWHTAVWNSDSEKPKTSFKQSSLYMHPRLGLPKVKADQEIRLSNKGEATYEALRLIYTEHYTKYQVIEYLSQNLAQYFTAAEEVEVFVSHLINRFGIIHST